MFKSFIRVLLLAFFIVGYNATELSAQASLKDAGKAMLQVFTFDASGSLIGSANGFFIAEDGTAVAPYSIFKGAVSAEVIDYNGKKHAINRIAGANENFDLVRFTTNEPKNVVWLQTLLADSKAESPLYLLNYLQKKKNPPLSISIESTEPFHSFNYYTVSAENQTKNFGCPMLDAKGKVVAVLQRNFDSKATTACAIDARFIHQLTVTPANLLLADLRAIKMPKLLPVDQQEALTSLYMSFSSDTALHHVALNDFIERYPEHPVGYTLRGNFWAEQGNYLACEADYQIAEEKSVLPSSPYKKDEVYLAFSKLIYQQLSQRGDSIYEGWNFVRASEEAAKAYAIQSSCNYLLQQAHCLSAAKQHKAAYEKYRAVCEQQKTDNQQWSALAKAENWFYAARSLELSGGNQHEVIALMDSTLSQFPKPYPVEWASYLLQKAKRLEAVGDYRRAVLDYIEYEKILGPSNLNARFYYDREQAEMKCGMYQQALDDIRTAISKEPNDPYFPIEEALILLRTSQFKEAIEAAENCLAKLPENPDCYKIIGIAYGEMGQKKKARTALQKAQSLGDSTVDEFLKKYR